MAGEAKAEKQTTSTSLAPQAAEEPHVLALDAIEPHGGEVEDDEFEPSDYESAVETETTSLSSSIVAHNYENGRRYHKFRHGRYPIPNDDIEQNREDMKHAMMLELTNGRLFTAPIGDNPLSILDLGTGTGIWAIDMGDKFPSAIVTGVDLSPIQPLRVPPNVKFMVDDVEDTWMQDKYDYIHGRYLASVVKNFAGVLAQGFEHLNPGGWFESQELIFATHCDDGTMPDDYIVLEYNRLVAKTFKETFDANIRISEELEPMFEEAGFVNIRKENYKVPIGPWAKDKTLRLVGLYWLIAIQDILPAMAGRPFLALGMSPVEIEVFMAQVRKSLADQRIHSYMTLTFVCGQKPA